MNNYGVPLSNPILQANPNYSNNQYNVNPTTRLTIEQLQNQLQSYQQNIQPQTYSNPYEDYINVLSSCSGLVKQKIMQDKDYQQADAECEMLIKQLWYSKIIPELLNYQEGRVAFEKLYNITKQRKQDYTQEEAQELQSLMQSKNMIDLLSSDPVVRKRLEELQNQQVIQPSEQKIENENREVVNK